jgi:hypothetical protein
MLNRVDIAPISYANKLMKQVYKPQIVQGRESIGVSER